MAFDVHRLDRCKKGNLFQLFALSWKWLFLQSQVPVAWGSVRPKIQGTGYALLQVSVFLSSLSVFLPFHLHRTFRVPTVMESQVRQSHGKTKICQKSRKILILTALCVSVIARKQQVVLFSYIQQDNMQKLKCIGLIISKYM